MSDWLLLDDSSFQNPAEIVLNFTTEYGPEEVTFGHLDSYMKTLLVFAIVYGVRIGMAFIFLPTTYLMAKNKKSPIFILNMLSLFFLFIQSILYSVTLTDQYNSLGYYFTDSSFMNRNNTNLTVASNLFYLLLIASIEISQTYQVFIIFESPQNLMKWVCYGVTLLSGFLGLATTVLYFIYMVESNISMFNPFHETPSYLVNVPLILFITSTCLICFVLILKLGFAIHTRRSLGLKQFNLFHILLIMTFQTMLIPMILVLISFNGFPGNKYSSQALSSLGTALVAISLPMTFMWANSSINSPTPTSQANTFFFNTKSSSGSDSESTSHYKQSPTTLVDIDLEKALNGGPRNEEEEEFWKEVVMYSNSPRSEVYDDTNKDLSFNSNKSDDDVERSNGSYLKTVETIINKDVP